MKYAVFLLAWCLSIFGCGSVEDPKSPGESLWSFEGQISDPNGVADRDLRAVLLWYRGNDEGGVGKAQAAQGDLPQKPPGDSTGDLPYIEDSPLVVQDVPVSATFPATFTLDVHHLPPVEALTDAKSETGAPAGRMAVGSFALYRDADGDHALTRVDMCAKSFVDTVVGHVEMYELVYWEPSEGATAVWACEFLTPGLNVFRVDPNGACGLAAVRPTPSDPPVYDMDITLSGPVESPQPLLCESWGAPTPDLLAKCNAQPGELVCFPDPPPIMPL